MFFAMLLFIICYYNQSNAQLEVGFYKNSCPRAESIIRDKVQRSFFLARGIAPGILRLHFHDCFVRGCDGSILIDSTATNSTEKDGPPNVNSLRGLDIIERAKSRIEATCKGVVSCADILAYAARDCFSKRGLEWDVPVGRRDGRISIA
ncbi:hypothetical protein M9H77_26289 [Catharanthus roseus]|uniref:Uncharacterized protein n=1 Tax=Catharanthus roseus TaxID=4058 RepID=A0ACC0ADB9_CATRO|nr:hypothetical protein M9H77_26289 [Catharanthus roseus]